MNMHRIARCDTELLGGILRYKRDGGGGGGVQRIFFGSKIFNSCIFLGLKNLRVFLWVRISARLMVAIYKPQKKYFLILCSKTSQP